MEEKLTDEEKEYYSLTRKAFAALAPFYDIIAAPFSGVRDRVVSLTNAQEGAKILDVATGTGKQAFAFAEKGYETVGIDLSNAMLNVAKKKSKFKNARFEVADATNLPFEDNSFDVSCVSFALHDMPLSIRKKVLREMVRVTRTKGIIVVADYGLPESKISKFLIYHFTVLFEAEYYKDFVRSDLEPLLNRNRIKIIEKVTVLHGAGRILKGINNKL
ncbi:2-heptaprenyl-1,4-naphthoquinone methyltransferase [Methanosarcina horonobensis HB-1 = JCM 15518]|uniref:2-heptaprenyl-1,4-naphthoquinone methyltransferase n=2 Tax=Methanosarcina horonobensis TaxID=418008 RepID=A0A0E3SES8_9EURY|nr:methyltransferase domain-containing protein [Methanosarcina horonobensis]AKB79501.1 2-heptaprenyl-1,4-naphthoquinone methyltransferase [Methanosarcina horonobensis HB-1 = JCM 15518]